MSLRTFILTIFGLALLECSCGQIGEPMYPSLNLPVKITDLRAVERGAVIAINFTIPPLTTDGVAVKNLRSVELVAGGKPVPVYRVEPGVVAAQIPVAGLEGQDATVRVRLINAKGHPNEWSNEVKLNIIPPLATPSQIRPENVPEGLRLTWSADGQGHFRIYRRGPGEPTRTVYAESDSASFVDTKIEYGKQYEYSVQGVKGTAESEISIGTTFTPKDEFPPAVPSGLSVSPGINTVELAWDRNTESDFKCYRVYRSVDGGAFERIADSIESPNFSDKSIQSGKRYRYTVSSVDQSNNESSPTAPMEIVP